jgi:hypothetical protein
MILKVSANDIFQGLPLNFKSWHNKGLFRGSEVLDLGTRFGENSHYTPARSIGVGRETTNLCARYAWQTFGSGVDVKRLVRKADRNDKVILRSHVVEKITVLLETRVVVCAVGVFDIEIEA